jgi:NDP-sugar pyrophosphorylase family protein
MQAVILAGGKGTRLKPYTVTFPKSLVPVGDQPILEIVIRQLKKCGITRIILAVGHLAGMIESYFGNGEKWGVSIAYSREAEPLGTAGPLRLIKGLEENFLVMNSDTLTDLDFMEFFNHHVRSGALVSIASYEREHKVDLGIIRTSESDVITEYIEKPVYSYMVSTGIYSFSRETVGHIPGNRYYDFPDLIRKLISLNEKVLAYPHEGYWLDIGRPSDYERACEEFEQLKSRFL